MEIRVVREEVPEVLRNTVATDEDAIITVKPTVNGGDNEYFAADQYEFEAPSSTYGFLNVQAPADGVLVLVLDFGGNPGKTFTITNISFVDDGIASGVEGIYTENPVYKVYNLNGINVLNTTDAARLNELPRGLYIINGKKVIL